MRRALGGLLTCLLGTTGCSAVCGLTPRSGCSPATVVVCVTDAETQTPLDHAIVEFDGRQASPDLGTHCRTLYDHGADRTRVTVRADGYAETSFEVSVPRDTCDDPVSQKREVALEKPGSSRQSLVVESPAPDTCG